MAMKIGGRYKFTEVQARHWQAFAEEVGLSWAQTSRRILALAERLPVLARQLQATPPFRSEPVTASVVDMVERRAALTLARLREGLNVSSARNAD
jgi:serine/threonine-protein kinase HipA